MPSSPNLGITHLEPNANQPEVVVNAAVDQLDEAANDTITISVSGSGDVISVTEFTENQVFVLSGSPGAAFDVTVPSSKRVFTVDNSTGQDATVTTGSGSTVTLDNDTRRILYCDGTNVVALAPEHDVSGSGGGGGGGGGTTFSRFRGALVRLSSNATISTGASPTTLSWGTVQHDSDSFFSGAQPTRLTVGAGISKVIVIANTRWLSASDGDDRLIQIRKNGGNAQGMAYQQVPSQQNTSAVTAIGARSGILEVTEGDYFEVSVAQNAGANRTVEAHATTWYSIYAVDATNFVGATAVISADQQITENTPTAIMFDGTINDSGHDIFTITSPTKLISPTDSSQVRLHATVWWEADSVGYCRAWFVRNGSEFHPARSEVLLPAVAGVKLPMQLTSGAVETSPFDEWELFVLHNSTQSGGLYVLAFTDLGSPAAEATTFSLEVVE